MRFGKTIGIGSLLFGAVIAATTPLHAEPRSVVTSILPVHSLVAGLVHGIHRADVLLPASASPHGYAMRPSEARLLQDADLFIWVGPELEAFLARPLSEPRGGRKVIGLMEDLPLVLLAMREGGVWETHGHDHGDAHRHDGHGQNHVDSDHHDHEHDAPAQDRAHSSHDDHEDHRANGHDHGQETHHDHDQTPEPAREGGHDRDHGHGGANDHDHHGGQSDAHVWLSPENARRIATGLTEHLVRWDPANAEALERNRDALLARIDALDAELRQQLEPVRDRPFLVFHDAYQYFERHYGLNAAGSITIDPSRAPGARRIQELRTRLSQDDIACLFTEPQFRPAMAQTLVEGHDTRLGELDPMGSTLAPGPDAWFDLMRGLADALTGCLAPQDS
jgi:zinc transport system substrate-binding protein